MPKPTKWEDKYKLGGRIVDFEGDLRVDTAKLISAIRATLKSELARELGEIKKKLELELVKFYEDKNPGDVILGGKIALIGVRDIINSRLEELK